MSLTMIAFGGINTSAVTSAALAERSEVSGTVRIESWLSLVRVRGAGDPFKLGLGWFGAFAPLSAELVERFAKPASFPSNGSRRERTINQPTPRSVTRIVATTISRP